MAHRIQSPSMHCVCQWNNIIGQLLNGDLILITSLIRSVLTLNDVMYSIVKQWIVRTSHGTYYKCKLRVGDSSKEVITEYSFVKTDYLKIER